MADENPQYYGLPTPEMTEAMDKLAREHGYASRQDMSSTASVRLLYLEVVRLRAEVEQLRKKDK
jgi:hypothetical protein